MKVTHGFVASPADRDDLFQEILIALWQALPKFNAQAKHSTYVNLDAGTVGRNGQRPCSSVSSYAHLHPASR